MEANGIVLSPDPRLRQECAVIEEITPAIEALAEKMKKMMAMSARKVIRCHLHIRWACSVS